MVGLLDPGEALRRVLAAALPLDVESVPLAEAAGRVLAADVRADLDLPPFTRSAMDGFAVRSADVASVPVELALTGEIMAGDLPARAVGPGEAVKIMTGAPIPDGADAVVMVERTEVAGEGRVRVLAAVDAGQNVIDRASDARAGDVVVGAGTRLLPLAIGAAAAVGAARVEVRRRPRAVFLSTGDELVEIDQIPGPGRIRNSNAYTVGAQLAACGARLERAEIVRDDPGATREAIRRALEADLVVLSGGVSMGEKDHVAAALAAEGVEIVFHNLAIKPGKPLVFGRRGRTLVFGLPGNPVSSYMTFLLFVAPAVRAMSGDRGRAAPRHLPARLAGRALQRGDRVRYLPARLGEAGGALEATPVPWHGSGDLVGATRADGFVVVPIGEGLVPVGERVDVLVDEAQVGPIGT